MGNVKMANITINASTMLLFTIQYRYAHVLSSDYF